jgi:hypothetical protein
VVDIAAIYNIVSAININLRKDVTTGVVVTIGKFATEVNDATVKLLPASLTREVHLELGIYLKIW